MNFCGNLRFRQICKAKLKSILSTASQTRPFTHDTLSNTGSRAATEQLKSEQEESPGTCLISLPVELQLEILKNLSVEDLLAVRASNTRLGKIIDFHEPYLSRHYVQSWPQNSVRRLYIPADGPSLGSLSRISLRSRIADDLAREVATECIDDLLSSPSHTFSPEVREKAINLLDARFWNALMILFHFFEQYKGIEVSHLVLSQYSDHQLLIANQMCDLLLKILSLPSIVPDAGGQQTTAPRDTRELSSGAMSTIIKMFGIHLHGHSESPPFRSGKVLTTSISRTVSTAFRAVSSLARRLRSGRVHGESINDRICQDLSSAFIRLASEELINRKVVSNESGILHGVDFIENILYSESAKDNKE